jgi:3'-phosphoadenosine 5'-phosphosulfate sulfotransferase (PAPS reductase)/FAD synthetase
MDHLSALEQESIYILRKAHSTIILRKAHSTIAQLAMLWSMGRFHRAPVAHAQGVPGRPYPPVHIDTSYEIPEMIATGTASPGSGAWS